MNLTNIATRRLSCEEMTRRQQEAELRWQCAASGQMDSSQQYEHERAGDFLPIGDRHAGIVGFAPGEVDGLGVEAADAARVTGTPIVTTELRPVREPWSGEAKLLIVAVVLTWLAILALSIADPRDLSTLWPRLVSLTSF